VSKADNRSGRPPARSPRQHSEDGTSTEYALAVTGVAALVLAALFGLGTSLADVFTGLTDDLNGAATPSGDVTGSGPAGPTGAPGLPLTDVPPTGTSTTSTSTTSTSTTSTSTTSTTSTSTTSTTTSAS
jgi:Flp pilus assembly pilin Flp